MRSNHKSVLDLFIRAKRRGPRARKHAIELLDVAKATLESIDPSYSVKTCDQVIADLEDQKRQHDCDLAILCYEAISYVRRQYWWYL